MPEFLASEFWEEKVHVVCEKIQYVSIPAEQAVLGNIRKSGFCEQVSTEITTVVE